MKSWTAERPQKLSKFLIEKYNGSLSYNRIKVLLKNKDIKINGKRISQDVQLVSGDFVEVYFDGEIRKVVYDILFQDENIAVVVKPKAIESADFYESIKNDFTELFFCHRLDRNTDGIMIFAKTQEAYDEILKAFKNKCFEKYYFAKVYGVFSEKSGCYADYLLKDEEKGIVKLFNQPFGEAKKAVLEYNVVGETENVSDVYIKLLTGRTHQIRAQFAKRGHFVLGDGKYGDDRISKSLGVKSLCLSSVKLVLHFERTSFLAYLNEKSFEYNCVK